MAGCGRALGGEWRSWGSWVTLPNGDAGGIPPSEGVASVTYGGWVNIRCLGTRLVSQHHTSIWMLPIRLELGSFRVHEVFFHREANESKFIVYGSHHRSATIWFGSVG
jgi:hypothetical protein